MPTPEEDVESCLVKLKESAEKKLSTTTLSASNATFLKDVRNLKRYAVARNGDYVKALEQLEKTLSWRDTLESPLHCPACDGDKDMHCFLPVGVSEPRSPAAPDGALVIYACAARAKTNDTAVTVQHMVHSLEHAWATCSREGPGPDKLCWFIDFNGFGLRHAMGGSTASTFMTHVSTHLPERLYAAVLINPPAIFDMLLAVLRPFIDARTMSKVHIIRPKAGKLGEDLEKFGVVNPTTLEWLEAALAMAPTPGNLPPLQPLGADVAKLQLEHFKAAFVAPTTPK
jgi:hypothetical protein